MQNKAHALAAGIFVLALTGLLLLLGAWLTRDSGQRHLYEISTREAVTGLQEQAPVRLPRRRRRQGRRHRLRSQGAGQRAGAAGGGARHADHAATPSPRCRSRA